MPFIRVGDIDIFYEIGGSGPRVVYISGTGGDLRRTPSIFESPLAEQFEILAFDQRGMGQTGKPDIPYVMADYANDANGLMAALGWENCPIMGVSFGGMVAPELALRYPNRVKSLVLACTSSGGAGRPSYPLHEFEGLSDAERRKRTLELSDTRHDAKWQAANPEELKALLKQAEESASIGADEPGREVGAHRQLHARKQHDVYDRLPSLNVPVFVCGGHYDGIAPPANLKALASQLPNAKLEFYEGGHGFLRQDERAYQGIIEFLKE